MLRSDAAPLALPERWAPEAVMVDVAVARSATGGSVAGGAGTVSAVEVSSWIEERDADP